MEVLQAIDSDRCKCSNRDNPSSNCQVLEGWKLYPVPSSKISSMFLLQLPQASRKELPSFVAAEEISLPQGPPAGPMLALTPCPRSSSGVSGWGSIDRFASICVLPYVFTVKAKKLDEDAAEWTKGVEDSVPTYVGRNCVEGIIVRSYHDTTFQIRAVFLFSTNRIGAQVRRHL